MTPTLLNPRILRCEASRFWTPDPGPISSFVILGAGYLRSSPLNSAKACSAKTEADFVKIRAIRVRPVPGLPMTDYGLPRHSPQSPIDSNSQQ